MCAICNDTYDGIQLTDKHGDKCESSTAYVFSIPQRDSDEIIEHQMITMIPGCRSQNFPIWCWCTSLKCWCWGQRRGFWAFRKLVLCRCSIRGHQLWYACRFIWWWWWSQELNTANETGLHVNFNAESLEGLTMLLVVMGSEPAAGVQAFWKQSIFVTQCPRVPSVWNRKCLYLRRRLVSQPV